jgi:hypothetical protein
MQTDRFTPGTVEFLPFAQGVPTRAEVTSIMGFDGVAETHTVYLLGRKE